MLGRLPESWIAPEHLLDLRARVRVRHTLVDQRREWQQRIPAVLYHHCVPPHSGLLGAESRPWLGGLRAAGGGARADHDRAHADRRARHAALSLDQQLRAYAKRQPGCRALMRHYGIGPLTAVTTRARPSATPDWTSPCTSPTRAAPRPPVPARPLGAALGAVRGRPMRPPPRLPRPRLLRRDGREALAPACPSGCARCPSSRRCTAAGSRHAPAATIAWTAFMDRAAAPHHGEHPINRHVAAPERPRNEDRDKARRPRAHDPHHPPRARPARRAGRRPTHTPLSA